MRILLLCHAEGMHDRYLHLGSVNSGLTARGWEQADVLADWLRTHERIDVLISDSVLQSRLTAQRIGQALGLPVTVDRNLPECSAETEAAVADEAEPTRLIAAAVEQTGAAESERRAAYRRALVEALNKILQEHWGAAVAIVTCKDGVAAIMQELFGARAVRLAIDHTAITELCHRGNGWLVNYVNRREHIPLPALAQSDERNRRTVTTRTTKIWRPSPPCTSAWRPRISSRSGKTTGCASAIS